MKIKDLRERLHRMTPLNFALFCVAWFLIVSVGLGAVITIVGTIGILIFFSAKYVIYLLTHTHLRGFSSMHTQGVIASLPAATINGVAGILKIAIFLPFAFISWQTVRLIPNKPIGLYHVQRAIQLFGIPLLLSIIGLSFGLPEGLYFGLAFFFFSPWFLRKGYVTTDKGRILEKHENWPFPESPAIRYILGALLLVAGLSTAFT